MALKAKAIAGNQFGCDTGGLFFLRDSGVYPRLYPRFA